MLQTLSAKSLAGKMGKSKGTLTLFDFPAIGQKEVGLQGINVQTSFLKGWEVKDIDRLRDVADKAACPCLLLSEDTTHSLADNDPAKIDSALDRIDRVLRVASRLGCSSVSLKVTGSGKTAEDRAAENLKKIISRAERMEINVLVAPDAKLTSTPEALTSLIRKVGGFRIGAFPDFQTACLSDDTPQYLRSLTPYASVVSASFNDFADEGIHKSFDLDACLDAIMSVGFEGSLSFEYRGKKDPIQSLCAMRNFVEAKVEASQKK
jgi:sugar phosphate isomerase/epimerase